MAAAIITVGAARRCGRRVRRWSSTGVSQGGLHVFCAVLAWSRLRFVRFAADEKRRRPRWRCWPSASRRSAGCRQTVLADRMGCLKGGVVANEVVPDRRTTCGSPPTTGSGPDFCEAADPESKGIVENLVGYAKTRPDRCRRRPFDDLAAANAAAAAWCAEVNAAVHSEICAVPAERLAVERELLGAVAVAAAEHRPRSVTRKVDRLSCVRFGSARYSVPTRLIGASVAVAHRPTAGCWSIEPGTGEVVAEHRLVAPGRDRRSSTSTTAARARRRARAVRPKTDAEKRFCALGPVAEAFLTGAAAAGNTRLGPELGRARRARRPRTATTRCSPRCDRAVAFGRWRAADVRSILAAGTGVPQPRAGRGRAGARAAAGADPVAGRLRDRHRAVAS